MSCKTVNLEAGMPTVSVAIERLGHELTAAKARGVRALKIIHGYGSSGTGGAIKSAVHRTLAQKQRSGAISAYVKGEDFSPFCDASRRITCAVPSLARDRDYSRGNDGITVVLL